MDSVMIRVSVIFIRRVLFMVSGSVMVIIIVIFIFRVSVYS